MTLTRTISNLLSYTDSSADHPSDAGRFAPLIFLRHKLMLLNLLRISKLFRRRVIEVSYQDDLQAATGIPNKPPEQWLPFSLFQFVRAYILKLRKACEMEILVIRTCR